jgi:hypothetical protein
MNNCVICDSKFSNINLEIEYCSNPCQVAEEMLSDLSQVIEATKPSEDPRIFFFPLSFGRLVDEFVILSLKRSYTKSIKRQQELDYMLFKCKKSIQTTLGQIFHDDKFREGMTKAAKQLFQINAMMWNRNDLARDKSIPENIRKERYWDLIELGDQRHKLIRQLDMMIQGKTTTFHIFAGMEW